MAHRVAEHLEAGQKKFAFDWSPVVADRCGDRGLSIECRLSIRLRFGTSIVHLGCFEARWSEVCFSVIDFDDLTRWRAGGKIWRFAAVGEKRGHRIRRLSMFRFSFWINFRLKVLSPNFFRRVLSQVLSQVLGSQQWAKSTSGTCDA